MTKIALAVILSFSILPIAAMEQQTTYPWYQAYKNPHVQESVTRGLKKGKEVVRKGTQNTQQWLSQHKKELIALGLAAAALLGGSYFAARKYMSSSRLQEIAIIKVYEKNKVEMPQDEEMREALYNIGRVVHEEGIDGLRKIIKQEKGEIYFKNLLKQYPTLGNTLAELAGPGVSAEDIEKLKYMKRSVILPRWSSTTEQQP